VASAGSLLSEVVSTTIFQRTVHDAIRGRALGAIATISTLAYALGSLVLPVASGIVGIGPVLLASAVLVLIGIATSIVLIGSAANRSPTAELLSAAAHAAALPVFTGIPEAWLATAFGRAAEVAVAAGDVVIRQGDPADRFYVILDGTFDVEQTAPDGGPARHLRTMGHDEVFGEIGLLTGSPRSATVRAAAPGRLLALEARDFLDLVAAGTEVGPRLLSLHRGGASLPG